ncbi:zinc ribbon domain-containing protein [Actinomycetospora chibensis]|uniref:Zinc ribbon domain-containing protein n=1 Tax=Actinomycetospora chibensis TaxID=663606 RepID=A0ABV9RJ19_9PSEU|nr:zinc ribbon domain-containing protein [Actinomycetospora chibensis]MDD7925015.1 zinc ribbon domain-containing protein [Actinomycetospora chibensis]
MEDRDTGSNGTRRATTAALLTGVLFCGRCGGKMYRNVRKDRRNLYHCRSNSGKHCGNGTVACDTLDAVVADDLMKNFGEFPHGRREYVHGTDNGSTIAEIDAELESYAAAVGRFPAGSPSWKSMMSNVDSLTARRGELMAQPQVASGWQHVRSGQTFAAFWNGLNEVGRNDFLRDNHVRVELARERGEQPTWTIYYGDVLGMIEAVNPELGETTRAWLERVRAGTAKPRGIPEVAAAMERYKRG